MDYQESFLEESVEVEPNEKRLDLGQPFSITWRLTEQINECLS
jgi:hypothetical protein